MEIKRKYFNKYLHDIAIEQIAEEYSKKGYEISKEAPLGKYQADIIARKGDEVVVIEVKAGKMTADKKKAIAQLADYVRKMGNYKFHVAIATPPKEKTLEIQDIASLLTNEIIENLPDELDQLSSHTRVEDVSDVDIDQIVIDGKSIHVEGSGVVNVELQFGSDSDQNSDDGFKTEMSFPFTFVSTMEYNKSQVLEILESEIEVDTSSYY